MPLVSVTRLRVRSWRFMPRFFLGAARSARQAGQAPGNLAVAVLRDRKLTFWTCTAWTDEASMKAFVLSGPHRAVMRNLLDWCDEASLVHWLQETKDVPAWPEAHRRLSAEGRPSKVRNPSEAHREFRIVPPVVTPRRQARLK